MKENEWISVNKYLPPVGVEIEVLTLKGTTIKARMGFYSDIGYAFCHSDVLPEIRPNEFDYWRHIQEKRPDFSKLRKGDLLHVFWDLNKSLGKFDEIDSYDFMIIDKSSCCKSYIKIKDIKKITRINLETRTFEEI